MHAATPSPKTSPPLFEFLKAEGTPVAPRTAEEIAAEDARWLERRKAREIEDTLTRIRGFYGILADSDWSHPTMVRNRAQVQKVLNWQMGSRGLLLPGGTGGGKSRCLAALLQRLARDGFTEIALWKAQHLFAEIASEFRYGVDTARAFIDRLAAKPLLVIEDLGQEGVSPNREDQTRQWFFDLLDERYAQARPLLCTTNHTRQSLINAEASREVSADPLLRRLTAIAEPVLPRFEEARGGLDADRRARGGDGTNQR